MKRSCSHSCPRVVQISSLLLLRVIAYKELIPSILVRTTSRQIFERHQAHSNQADSEMREESRRDTVALPKLALTTKNFGRFSSGMGFFIEVQKLFKLD
jgi:heterodisulfide reductase subunit C